MRKILVVGLGGVLVLIVAVGAAYAVRRNMNQQAGCDRVQQLEATAQSERAERANQGEPVVAFLGDSYTQGQHLNSPFDAFPYQAVSAGSVVVDGRGGSGYTPSGPCEGETFGDRIDDVLATGPAVLVIQGGVNDVAAGWDGDDIDTVLDAAEGVDRVVVLGPFEPPNADAEETEEFADYLEDAATERGYEYVSVDGWVTSWLPDGIHPDEEGAAQIGAELMPILAAAG